MNNKKHEKVSFSMINLEEYPHLNRMELEKIRDSFHKREKDHHGCIFRYDIIEVLRDIDQYINESVKKKLFDDLDNRGLKYIDLPTMCYVANYTKKLEEDDGEEDVNDDYINAFVALGGNPDRTGYVQKSKILEIVNEEFGLSIEEFLEEISETDVDFSTFCKLFEAIDESRALSRMSGVTVKTFFFLDQQSRTELKRPNTNSSFVVRYRDFEKYLAKESHGTK